MTAANKNEIQRSHTRPALLIATNITAALNVSSSAASESKNELSNSGGIYAALIGEEGNWCGNKALRRDELESEKVSG